MKRNGLASGKASTLALVAGVVIFVIGVIYSVVVTVGHAHAMGITGFDVVLAFEYVQRSLMLTDFASALPAVACVASSFALVIWGLTAKSR